MKFLILLVLSTPFSRGFVHPGLLHTATSFNLMRTMVQNNTSPWVNSWNILLSNGQSNPSYKPTPQAILNRGWPCSNPDNSYYIMNDVAAAYQLALRWKISGDTSCANAAVNIMNAWSSTLQSINCINGSSYDYILLAGLQGYQFANVGEIMRNYSGLTQANFTNFQNMMRNIFYPVALASMPNTALAVYSSWDLSGMAAVMAIGVLTDNQTMFNQSLSLFYTNPSNGGIENMVYYVHPGYLGQTQESGRDQGHDSLSVALLSVIAEQAWNQGVDLYGYSNNRILMASEYVAMGNLNNSATGTYYNMPYTPYKIDAWPTEIYDTVFSNGSLPSLRPAWASLYNHYANRKGIAAPFTGRIMNLVAPDGGGGNYGGNSGGYDQLGFETLTFTLPNISSGAGPTGLTGYYTNGRVVLSWWGSQYATSYNVYRSTNASSGFSKIANVVYPLTYSDTSVSATTYYYYITSLLSPWESTPSNTAAVVANPQALTTFYAFDETSGTTAYDSSGNRKNATLVGGVTHVAGIVGNAIQLDGSTGYVVLPSFVLANQSDFTIAAWLKLTSISQWARLFDFGFGTDRYLFFSPQGINSNASFSLTSNQGPGEWQIRANAPLPMGKWCHIAITVLGNVGTYYLNGTAVASTGTGTSSAGIYQQPYQLAMGANAFTPQVWIGRSQYAGDPYLKGIVDEFRIYQGALTAAQVSSLYSSTASG